MDELRKQRVAVIGAGKMGVSLIHALIKGHDMPPEQIIATGRRHEVLAELHASTGVKTSLDNLKAIQDADIILLCVKPQMVNQVLVEIGVGLSPKQILVSIAAGMSTAMIELQVNEKIPVVRAMPNTPVLIGEGMTALCGGRWALEPQVAGVRELFAQMGRTVVLEEKLFDAVTGLSASGPAFVYVILESMAEGGVKAGLPRQLATELAAQACLGASRMVLETGDHPALLKDYVTTPAGCTMDGILKLEEGGLRVTLIKAVEAAAQRAGELVE
jgi:pyrroline-5-carboxylate reductase